jgi:putative acetyltransferase
MFLRKEFRSKGYGKLLLELCIEKARKFNYSAVYLETLSQMQAAINLYTQHGFSILKKPIGNTGHTGCNVQMILELK